MLSVSSLRARGKFLPTLRRARKDDKGFTAVEFALVAAPFLAFVFAILEVALVYFGTFTLENAVDQASRQIRTGQAQTAGWDKSAFVNEVCSKVATFSDCPGKLKVDVRAFTNFSGAQRPDAFDPNGDLDENNLDSFDLGEGGDVVLVSVYYKWDLIGSIPGIGLQNQSDDSRLIIALAAFRNEPFDPASN